METKKLEACDFNPTQLCDLHNLLGQFGDIFGLPTKLPPSRDHDHQIPLIPYAQPPNIRPYHYGPLQKTKIEKVVKELLNVGFIRPSHCPFSCLLLLVKKKEAT